MLSSSSRFVSDADVEKNIHFIWMGSSLRTSHLEKIKEWRILNPLYQLHIWINPSFKSEIETQLTDTDVQIHFIDDLHFNQKTSVFFSKLTSPRIDEAPANYAGASDGYRMKIIHDFGGWYTDMDVTPLDLSKINISHLFNFYINASRKFNRFSDFSPSIFAFSRQHIIIQTALDFLDLLAENINDEHTDLMRSKLASIRFASTVCSTGAILTTALAALRLNGTPFIEGGDLIPNTAAFDLVASKFESRFERSWLLASGSMPGDNLKRAPMPRLILDNRYLKSECDCLECVPEIIELIRKSAWQLTPRDIEINREYYIKYHSSYHQIGLFAFGDRPALPIYRNEADQGLGL